MLSSYALMSSDNYFMPLECDHFIETASNRMVNWYDPYIRGGQQEVEFLFNILTPKYGKDLCDTPVHPLIQWLNDFFGCASYTFEAQPDPNTNMSFKDRAYTLCAWKILLDETDKFDNYLQPDMFDTDEDNLMKHVYNVALKNLPENAILSTLLGDTANATIFKFFTPLKWKRFYERHLTHNSVFGETLNEDYIDYLIYLANRDRTLATTLLNMLPTNFNLKGLKKASMTVTGEDTLPSVVELPKPKRKASTKLSKMRVKRMKTSDAKNSETVWEDKLKEMGLDKLVDVLRQAGCNTTSDVVWYLDFLCPDSDLYKELGQPVVDKLSHLLQTLE